MKTLSCDRYYSRSSVVFVSHPSRVVVVVVVMHSPTKVPRDSYYYVYYNKRQKFPFVGALLSKMRGNFLVKGGVY